MTDDDLDVLEALAKAATPGPWHSFTGEPYGAEIAVIGSATVARPDNDDAIEPGDDLADAAYIAAVSPDVVLGLVAQLRAASVGAWLRVQRATAP